MRSGSGYSTIKLSDLLSSKPFVSFFVKTTGDTCELFVNDKKVTSDAVTLVEGDYIELR